MKHLQLLIFMFNNKLFHENALESYEMLDSQPGMLSTELAIYSHLIFIKLLLECTIIALKKRNHKLLLNRTLWLHQIPMAAKPIKTLQMQYPMIQFLIIADITTDTAGKVGLRIHALQTSPLLVSVQLVLIYLMGSL